MIRQKIEEREISKCVSRQHSLWDGKTVCINCVTFDENIKGHATYFLFFNHS